MADDAFGYLPSGDSLESMFATSSTPAISAIKRVQSIDDNERPRKRPRNESQTIATLGVSGNASVVNVGGDNVTHIHEGVGADAYTVLDSIERRLKVVQDEKLDKEVQVWLSAPDVSQNLNAALRKRQAGTGTWFLESEQFTQWKENNNIVLCIYGAPGCGKTVLCSTIIQAVKGSCTTPLSGWAYFFFDSRNTNLKGLVLYENFLRSILSQLCSRCDGVPEAVEAMYRSHGKGRETPSVQALEETLQQVMMAFDDIYIMIDSVDECGDRIDLLQWIRAVSNWNSVKCHVLATTRPEPDIKERLDLIYRISIIRLQGSMLDRDISDYLDGRLSLNNRWTEPIRALIRTILRGRADGMFRWVAMQMDNLERCLNTRDVKEKLKTLPKDLEDSYEKILTGSRHAKELLLMLHWLAFSARELRLEEIAEVPSVDFDAADGPCYDPDLKYSNPSVALTVCSGLVTETNGIVKLAHFSVKEYLISDRIKTGMAAQFAMSERLSHSIIVQTCVAYLMIFNTPDCIQTPVETTGPFPLHIYAAEHTSSHLNLTHTASYPALQKLLQKLFTPTQRSNHALANWVRMYDAETHPSWVPVGEKLSKRADDVASPLYYASWHGLECTVEQLFECGENINLLGGRYGTALQAASYKGSISTTKLLLEHGADVNLRGGYYGTALQAAVYGGSTETVKLLLQHGADVNLQGEHITTLQVAVHKGLIETTKLLLEHGALVNIQGGLYGTALQAAVNHGSIEMVKLLFEHGADVNIQGGRSRSALQAAIEKSHIEMIKLLLEHGADVHLQGRFGNLLQTAAATQYSAEPVKLLLEHGADVNCQGGAFGTALHAAAAFGSTETVKLLVEHGADVNIQGGLYENALLAARIGGHSHIEDLLLQHGATVEEPDSH